MTLRVRQKWAETASALTCGLAELAAKTNLPYVMCFYVRYLRHHPTRPPARNV